MPPRDNANPPSSSRHLLEIQLGGHLTRAALDAALQPVTHALQSRGGRFDLIVDARGMTGYEGDARARFVEWNAAYRGQLRAVAILTDNALWRMVIRAMSLASGQVMQPFADKQDAVTWFATVSPDAKA